MAVLKVVIAASAGRLTMSDLPSGVLLCNDKFDAAALHAIICRAGGIIDK